MQVQIYEVREVRDSAESAKATPSGVLVNEHGVSKNDRFWIEKFI